jgi:hypothetical protein
VDVLRWLVGSGIARRVELVGSSNGAAAEAFSGEQVERLGLHAGVQALWVREEALGVLNWPWA